MLKALYFPHTNISNPTILKNALLLWDNVETIIPSDRWQPDVLPKERLTQEAEELVVSRRIPTDTERHRAHQSLAQMEESGFLTSLVRQSPGHWHNSDYLIYPEKFLKQTWHLLKREGMARWVDDEQDYGVPAAVGFLMMSVLADVCAGSQIRKVTDRIDAYNWLAEMHAKTLNSQYVTGLDPSQVAPAHDRIVALSLEVLDGRQIPLKKLVEMRKREAKQGGSDYRAMRRRYTAALESHLKRVGKEAKSEADYRELDRQFKEELKQDLADLQAELGIASKKALFSKEVTLTVLILAGSLISPIASLTALGNQVGGVGIIPLMKAAVDYRAARRDALKKHTMSWLYTGKQARLSLH